MTISLAGCSAGGPNGLDNRVVVTVTAGAESGLQGSPITRRQQTELYEERRLLNKDRLTVSVFVEDLTAYRYEEGYTGWKLAFRTVFTNTASAALVFREPKRVGFTQTADLMVSILTSTRSVIANPILEGMVHLPLEEDFITIQEGEHLEVTNTIEFPPVDRDGDGDLDSPLPPGEYALQVRYSNRFVGYVLPLQLVPPEQLHGQALRDWYSDHETVADLNAWVGEKVSQDVPFSIPEN